jgi:hypothetical protein
LSDSTFGITGKTGNGGFSEAFMSLEGYTSTTSVVQKATINFHVNNVPAAADTTVRLDIDRYAPAGPVIFFTDSFPARSYPTPSDAYAVGCGWPSSYSLAVPATWASGYYRATLTNASGDSTAIPFVVRASAPGSYARLLFCVPVTTFQAYNSWGGKSLYGNEAPDRSKKVSFDRPGGSGPGFELALAQWLVNKGIAVEFCTSVDLHAYPTLLSHYQLRSCKRLASCATPNR